MEIKNLTQGNNFINRKNLLQKKNRVSFCGKISHIDKPKDLIDNLRLLSEDCTIRQMGIINYEVFVSLLQKGVLYVKSLFKKDNAHQELEQMYKKSYNVLDKYSNCSKDDISPSNVKDDIFIGNCAEIYALALETGGNTNFSVGTSQYAAKLSQAILTTLSREKFDDERQYIVISEKYKEIKRHLDVAHKRLFPENQILEKGNVSLNFKQNERVIDGLIRDNSIYYTFGDSTEEAYKSITDRKEAHYFMRSYKLLLETIKLLEQYSKLTDENRKLKLFLKLKSIPNDAKSMSVIPKERLNFDENDITYAKIKSSFLDKEPEDVGEKNSSIKEEGENFVFYSAHKDEPEANVKVDKNAEQALNKYFQTISKLCGQKTYATLLHLAHRFLQRNPLYEGTKIVYGVEELKRLEEYVKSVKGDIDILLNKNISDFSNDREISYFNEANGNRYILALNPNDRGKYQNKTYTIFIYKQDNDNKESLLNCNLLVDNNGNYGLSTFIDNDNKLLGDLKNLQTKLENLKTQEQACINSINKIQETMEKIEKKVYLAKSAKTIGEKEEVYLAKSAEIIEEKKEELKKYEELVGNKQKEIDEYIVPWKRYQLKPNVIMQNDQT